MPAKECIIVSEPFMCNTRTEGLENSDYNYKMIMVDYKDQTHMVLFYENCVK